MIDFLTAVTASVDDDAETVDGTFLHGQLSSQPKHFTQKSVVLRLGVSQRLNVLLGNDQEVHGSLRMDVLEGQNFIIYINFGCRNFATGDAAELAIVKLHVNLWKKSAVPGQKTGSRSFRTLS